MRIISGEFKGRQIRVPKSKLVRPTTDRNKESIFNYLVNKIDFNNIRVCDLYAGSGSLGFESLSRGAAEVHFVEKHFHVYKNLIQNITSLAVSDRTKIFKMSCLKFATISSHSKYDLIIADPPFFKDDIYSVIVNLIKNEFLEPGGIIIIERSVQTEKEDILHLGMKPIKKLGDSLIYEYIFS